MASHLQFLRFFPLRRFLLLFLLSGFELRPDGRLFLFLRRALGLLGLLGLCLGCLGHVKQGNLFPGFGLGFQLTHGPVSYTHLDVYKRQRFTRCKTLGENYTEEAITRRIKGLAVDRGPKRQRKGITLRIDLENNIKAQQSAGYARWAKLENLKQAAKTINFLTEHGIEQYAELESKVAEISAANDEAAAALKDVEHRLGDMAVLIKNLTTYKQLRPVVLEYRKAKYKAAFRREHESQLILYEAAAKAIKDAGITRLPDLAALKAEYRELDKQKARLYEQYGEVKRELKKYGIIKQNVDSILRVTPGKEQTQEL